MTALTEDGIDDVISLLKSLREIVNKGHVKSLELRRQTLRNRSGSFVWAVSTSAG
jgi:hypothetical protein